MKIHEIKMQHQRTWIKRLGMVSLKPQKYVTNVRRQDTYLEIVKNSQMIHYIIKQLWELENLKMNVSNTSEADRVAMEEDDINEIGEEEKEKLNDVDYLTGNSLPNDILLYAVPVCGPYTAVQSYKYRVKIIPGTAKKGKAAKTAMNLFSHMPESTSREKELMKAFTDPELVAAIIGNVKIAPAGLTQLKQKQKQGKKGNKQGT